MIEVNWFDDFMNYLKKNVYVMENIWVYIKSCRTTMLMS